MPEFHGRAWNITVRARISNLYIKFKATVKKRPSGKFQRFIKLDKFLIGVGVDSESGSRIVVQRRMTVKSRILRFVKKHLGRRRSKNKKTVGFKMPNVPCPYLVAEIESGNGSWHFGRLELSCVAAFGVGLGYVLGELISTPTLKRNVGISPTGFSSFIMVCLVLWIHKFKLLWAVIIALLPVLLLQIDRLLQHFDLGQLR